MRQRFRNKKRRIERQEEATERQARYDAMSPDDKVYLAASRPGFSLRQMQRFDAEGLALPIGGVRLA